MSANRLLSGFDGLMALSRREGVDIRPTLLRVLTDLYVQSATHTPDEERQFTELASRLLDDVDDATRAVVRAKLTTYPRTPHEIRRKLAIKLPLEQYPVVSPIETETAEVELDTIAAPALAPAQMHRPLPMLSMKPQEASSLIEMFLAGNSKERAKVLEELIDAPLKPSVKVDPRRAARAVTTLEAAAMSADIAAFANELADALILPMAVARQIVNDPLGEPLVCALKALGMPSDGFQRVLLFLNPTIGKSVMDVYRLARMYDVLNERVALIMLAAWRGSSIATTRAKYQPALYDDERNRARPTNAARPAQTDTAVRRSSDSTER
jgi:Uncharacterised protein conserved in bacteria (DUF2336)